MRLDETMQRIFNSFPDHEYIAYLSGEDNFRKKEYPDYKANRTKPKPNWLMSCRIHLVDNYNAKIVNGYEADDAIGIAAGDATIIVSIDKDLRTIAGTHYNFVKDELFTVSEHEAAYNFWTQMLVGDTSDNVYGINGIGPVKAARALAGLDPIEMEELVKHMYGDEDHYNKNLRLLTILREEPLYDPTIRETERTTPPAVSEGHDPKEVPTTGE